MIWAVKGRRVVIRGVVAALVVVFVCAAQIVLAQGPGVKGEKLEGTPPIVVNKSHLQLRYYASTEVVRPDLRFTLVADVFLPAKMHVYTPEVKGYIPIQFKLEDSSDYTTRPAVYPKGELLLLPAINEIVPVYQRQFRITQDVVLAATNILQPVLEANKDGNKILKIRGMLKYQACDDKICYLPESIPLEWTFRLEAAPASK